MVEVLVCNDPVAKKQLFLEAGIDMKENSLCIRAMCGNECIGYCLFEINQAVETVFFIHPENDRLLADGLLRSALHVGTERGVTEAFYGKKVDTKLLEKINFLENREEKRLKLQNLFSDCCCSGEKNNM